jgi:DUF971 family protein
LERFSAMTSQSPKPDQISLDLKQGILQIIWLDGHVSQYEFAYLRRHCPCAECRPWIHGGPVGEIPASVLNANPRIMRAEDVSLVGSYALNIRFADGHATGIYTWPYLREICPCPEDTARREAARQATEPAADNRQT